MNHYDELISRNADYISAELQDKIRNSKLLIAGCGDGSLIAEMAARTGFTKFTLVDADTVGLSNINRQVYVHSDLGTPKVSALAKRIRDINPECEVEEVKDWITVENAAGYVAASDFIFETIDYLSLDAIIAVHDEANRLGKPVVASITLGFGASAFYCPPYKSKVAALRTVLDAPPFGPIDRKALVCNLAPFMMRLFPHINPQVANAMYNLLTVTDSGEPRPASHMAAGTYAVASLAVTMAVRVLNGEEVTAAPELVIASMTEHCARPGPRLSPEKENKVEVEPTEVSLSSTRALKH